MPLYPSQQEILDSTSGKKNVAFYVGCGGGKTWLGSTKAMEIANPFTLVVCQKSQINDWVNHFKDNYPSVTVTDLTKLKKFTIADLTPGVLVINYDLLINRAALLKLRKFTLLLDESSMIQHSKTKRTKFVLRFKPNNVIMLSGTPVSGAKIDKDEGLIFGKYENLIPQIKLLGWKITQDRFWDEYVNWEMRYFGEIRKKEPVSYKNIKELNAKLKELGCVFRRTEDIVELPEFDDKYFYVPTIPECKKMIRDSVVYIDDEEIVADYPQVKYLRLRQLCAHYNKHKAGVLSDLLDSLENERVIIFYSFVPELEVIKKVVGDRPMFQINGDVKDFDEEEFARPENYNAVVACQYQSGSRGHNMQAAKYIIYMSVTNSAEYFDQSRGRIRRDGQKADRGMYYHILAKGSIEEDILSNVSKGIDFTVDDYQRLYERKED